MMTQPQPSTTPRFEEPKFGFNEYAERLNGRAAMIGFFDRIIEVITGQGTILARFKLELKLRASF